MMKKIIPIFLVVLMLTQTTAMATDKSELPALIEKHMTGLVDMDRVYKYDYMEFDSIEEEIPQEVFKYHNAVNAVLALGLMEKLPDGTFSEQDAVPFKTFANIIMKLTTGYSAELEEAYALYPDTRYTNFDEAAYYLVGAAGYGVYESRQKGENPRSLLAQQIGLTRGLTFGGEKNITRGELAQMILNTLQIDMIEQTTYGDKETFEKTEGKNLIGEIFDASFVYGTVTAQNGINLYVENSLEKDTISIDRVVYSLNGYKVGDVLGYQVQAVVRNEDNGAKSILGLSVDENDKTLSLALDGNTYTDGRYVYYYDAVNNKEKKQSLAGIEQIILNDESITKEQLIEAIDTVEGEIRFGCTEQGGSYNLVLVRGWSTYVVKSASTMDEKIYLNYGATFKSNDYIDVNDRKYVTIEKAGQLIELKDVIAGSVIDVIENQAGNVVAIVVTDKKITGTITERDNDIIYINGKKYGISSAFEAALENNPTMSDANVGVNGEFKLNKTGKIVSFSSMDAGNKLGLLKEFGRTSKGLNSKTVIKVFTEDNEWKQLELARELVMDGIEDVTEEKAYASMEAAREKVCYAPIRFRLNSEGRVQFLDTALVNDVERKDSESIIKAASYTGETNWTSSAKAEWSGLTDSKYFYTQATTFITIPKDPSKEKEYTISKTSYLTSDMNVTMELYNVDDFFGVGLVVRSGTSTNVIPFANNYSWIVFTGLSNTLNEDGEPIKSIQGFDGSSAKFVQNSYNLNDAELIAMAQTFSPGDLIHISADGKDMLEMEVWCEVENLGVDIGDDTATIAMEGLGTVLDVDPTRNLVKVNVNGQETTWRIHCLGLFDLKQNKGQIITAGDICPGDRVFGIGGFNYMRTLIIR